jgi:hypothetical protein
VGAVDSFFKEGPDGQMHTFARNEKYVVVNGKAERESMGRTSDNRVEFRARAIPSKLRAVFRRV